MRKMFSFFVLIIISWTWSQSGIFSLWEDSVDSYQLDTTRVINVNEIQNFSDIWCRENPRDTIVLFKKNADLISGINDISCVHSKVILFKDEFFESSNLSLSETAFFKGKNEILINSSIYEYVKKADTYTLVLVNLILH